MIQESENLDFKNLEDGYALFERDVSAIQISMVHGKMKPSEKKDEEMRKFVEGTTQILVATTVIKVGVNVPNASRNDNRKCRAVWTFATAPIAR